MVDQAVVGQPSNTSLAIGSTQNLRAGRLAELIVQELHGRYYESAYNKAIFTAASQAAATTTVGLATTYTGLCVSNSINSPVNLAINKCSFMQSVIQATQPEAFALAVGFNASTNVTHTTPGTPQSSVIGSGITANAKVDIAATLPTAPTYYAFVQNTPAATTNGAGGIIDLEGSLIIPPGGYILWATPAQASVAGMWFSIQWEEIPL